METISSGRGIVLCKTLSIPPCTIFSHVRGQQKTRLELSARYWVYIPTSRHAQLGGTQPERACESLPNSHTRDDCSPSKVSRAWGCCRSILRGKADPDAAGLGFELHDVSRLLRRRQLSIISASCTTPVRGDVDEASSRVRGRLSSAQRSSRLPHSDKSSPPEVTAPARLGSFNSPPCRR